MEEGGEFLSLGNTETEISRLMDHDVCHSNRWVPLESVGMLFVKVRDHNGKTIKLANFLGHTSGSAACKMTKTPRPLFLGGVGGSMYLSPRRM